jgi:hypothetical protein
MIHHYASIPDVFELTTTPLSRPSKGPPTVIEFARLERGITSTLLQRHRAPGDTCGDRYESTKRPTLSGRSVPTDMVTRTLVEIARMRTPSDEDVPRSTMDTSLFRHWGEKARIGSV